MRDPLEGVDGEGRIVTGAARHRVPAVFEPILADAASILSGDASLYVYGSVATGQAVVLRSDLDLIVIGGCAATAAARAAELSARYATVCRAVEIAWATPDGFDGVGDEPYGNRVFLRHYSVHVAGRALSVPVAGYPADARAARGFNGDIARHAARWRVELSEGTDAGALARRVARKTLLAVAGLVSVHDRTWTTDREMAAHRWASVDPTLADGVRGLLTWIDEPPLIGRAVLVDALDGVVARITDAFRRTIGLWDG